MLQTFTTITLPVTLKLDLAHLLLHSIFEIISMKTITIYSQREIRKTQENSQESFPTYQASNG